MVERDPYQPKERVLFFVSLAATCLLVPLYFLVRPGYNEMLRDFGGMPPAPTVAFFTSGWLAAIVLAGIPASLFASLLCARRKKRLFFGVLALSLAIAAPMLGAFAAQAPIAQLGPIE